MDQDPIKRLSDLIELAKPREMSYPMTMEKCLQLLNEMHQMGSYYASRDEEKAFIFCVRFISIVVEELPKSSGYMAISQSERYTLDIRTLNCMNTAEQMKCRIKQRYEKEMLESRQQCTSSAAIDQMSAASTSSSGSRTNLSHQPPQHSQISELDHLTVPDQHLCPYVRCQAVSMQPIVFQRVIIPNNIPELFLAQQLDNNGMRFALLYGRFVSNNKSVIVSQLLPTQLESISDQKNIRRFVPDLKSGEDLPVVGCICSSLSRACQSGFFKACQISEMVCIVCAPGPSRTILLHLVNMSPSGGSPAHLSTMTSSGLPCAHQHITDQITAVFVRNESNFQLQNGNTNLDIANQQRKSPANESTTLIIKTTTMGSKSENAGGEELMVAETAENRCNANGSNGNSSETMNG